VEARSGFQSMTVALNPGQRATTTRKAAVRA
jgi:hypothetical protein